MEIIYGYICECGNDRNKNQDSMFFGQGGVEGCNVCVAAVCDGIGSFTESEFASQFVTEFLYRWFNSQTDTHAIQKTNNAKKTAFIYDKLKNDLTDALWLAHRQITAESLERNFTAGTTVCVFLAVHNLYCVCNSGDSRAYKIASGKMHQLTADQTVQRNGKTVLTNCIGSSLEPGIVRTEGKIRKKSLYVLASDGFYRKLDEVSAAKSLLKARTSTDMLRTVRSLRTHTLGKGEKDDSTGIALKFI